MFVQSLIIINIQTCIFASIIYLTIMYLSFQAEYQFMYEMAIQCMSQYDTYANFQ